jgi:hypothetical protein
VAVVEPPTTPNFNSTTGRRCGGGAPEFDSRQGGI